MENQEKVEKVTDSADLFFEDLKKLQEQHKGNIDISIDFPDYKVLPDDLQLALMVMSKHKLRYVIGFKKLEVKE